jgi:hypothetical protein
MKKLLLVFASCVLFLGKAPADDGMWLPHQIKDLQLAGQGLQLDPATLYKADGSGLAQAIVSLGGGTGEFVSSQGLILTNHHVAFGAIQRAASVEHDYINDGFYAARLADEIPARGMVADVLLGYDDVTAAVLKGVKPGQPARERADGIEKNIKQMVALEEAKGRDLVCNVRPLYSGGQYMLFRFKRLRDIRLVYAPPQALGNFGGEVDNWVWPRHTCDFSFLRAYVSRANLGVEYSADNVPYAPKSILKISLDGVKEGDFNMIIGFPGRTYRNNPALEFQYALDTLARRARDSRARIAFLEEMGKGQRAIEIKYASTVKGLYNGAKNAESKLDGIARQAIAAKIVAREQALRDWIAATPENQKKFATLLPGLDNFMPRYRAFNERYETVTSFSSAGPALVGQAVTLYRLLAERKKPDLQREPGFQERDLAQLRQRSANLERSFDMSVDKALAKWVLQRAAARGLERLPQAIRSGIGAGGADEIAAFVDRLYAATTLHESAKRQDVIDGKISLAAALQDPLVAFAAALETELRQMRQQERELTQELLDLKRDYEAALKAMHGGRLASDANGTMRVTVGTVQGYAPRDAVTYAPFTTLAGLIEKDTGRDPFAVPEKIKRLVFEKNYGRYLDPRLQDVVTCFINTTNVTGGNSGSPVLNARGEQVGIIFDMTGESVIGDYYIIPALQRSIVVDIRFVLFVADKFTGATRLLSELGL